MRFNINDHVRVRLTDFGRQAMRKNHAQLYEGWKGAPPEMWSPKEDAEGWSEWQLWSLIQAFGPHMSLGMNPPFETEIDIPEKSI